LRFINKPARGSAAQLDPHGHFRPVVRDRTDAAMSDPIVLKVAMMCAGCSGAVERVLTKMEGAISSLPLMSPTSRTAPRQRRAGDERRPVGTAGGVVTPRARHTTRALLSAGSIIRAFPRDSPSDRPTDTRMFPTTSAPRPLARVRAPPFPQASSRST
jgi:hypothetical protein